MKSLHGQLLPGSSIFFNRNGCKNGFRVRPLTRYGYQRWLPDGQSKTYQDVYKVRFDGSKDLHCKIEINSRVEVDN